MTCEKYKKFKYLEAGATFGKNHGTSRVETVVKRKQLEAD